MEPDFSGWATKNNMLCSDGRTIMPDSFKHQDGAKVPLVWNHQQNDPGNVIGYAVLKHREEGVWTDAYLNNTERAEDTRELIRHGDVNMLSIHANNLKEKAKQVLHGMIREVSVVLAGANPGAYIETVNLSHSDGDEVEEAIIYTGLTFSHADQEDDVAEETSNNDENKSEKTVKDVVESMTEEQKNALFYLLGASSEEESSDEAEHSDNNSETITHSQEDGSMTHNIFEGTDTKVGDKLTHAQQQAILNDAKKLGSLKEACLMHAEQYGVNDIELLFPEARTLTNTPEFVKRDTEWVDGVLSGVNKVPFSRVKSLHSDITHEEARAKGYIKGNLKKEEFFGLTQRKTGPATIYKKQKLDRDDIIDATTLDVVNWLWQEMRLMLNEEIARAILIGDGREVSDPDKVKAPSNTLSDGDGIRPIATDHEFYAYQVKLPAGQNTANMIKALVRQRRYYKGTGNPTLYTTEDVLTDMLLLEDKLGRPLYDTEAALATKLRVSKIVPVEVMESDPELIGIFVNLRDYTVGTDKGGQITSFDQFDIDYNQYKYLIEGRMSGALTKHRSAVVVRRAAGTEVVATAPTFDEETNTLTIPTTEGVQYFVNNEPATAGDQTITEDTWVQADPKAGYFLKANSTAEWSFTYNAEAAA